jgi:hypothetical protein
MPYDPNGDPNVDPEDLASIEAFLNDPTVKALHDDLGRQFAAVPPEEQIEELVIQMVKPRSVGIHLLHC